MTATEAPDNVNPFTRRVMTQPAPAEEDADAEEVTAALAAEAAPAPDAEKERKRIEFAAKMAAGRAVARERRAKEKAADAANPDKPIAETERLRQKLTNFIPDTTSLEIWKVIDGQPIWVGDYDARAVASSKNVRHFIHKNLYKKHRATTWEVVHINSDGKERAPYRLNIDPDPEEVDPVNRATAEVLKEIKDRPSQMKETIEGLRELKTLASEDEPPPPPTMTFMEFMAWQAQREDARERRQPREDPRIAIMTENQRRLESELMALKNAPPPAPITLGPPPESFSFKDAIALIDKMNAPMLAQIQAMERAAEKRDERMREDLKEARKSVNTGGHGGLESLRDQLKLLSEIDKERNGGGGTDLIKFGTMVKDFVKELRETDQASKQQNGAQASGPTLPGAWPAGFEAEVAKIGAATDEAGRLGATLGAYEFLVKSGDPFWLRFHALIVDDAKKGETAKVREYVDAFLDGVKQFVPEPARKSALEAFDKNADGVIKLLAAA